MRPQIVLVLLVLALGSSALADAPAALGPELAPAATRTPLAYPKAERQPIVETRYRRQVADPYRWLEDGKDPKVQAWARAEDQLTRAQFAQLPGRAALTKRMKELLYTETVGVPQRAGARLFFERQAATAEKSAVWVRGPGGNERVVLDPLSFAADGTISIGAWRPSHDGRRIAYTRNPNNADEATLYIRDLPSRQDLPEHIDGVTYGMFSWSGDGEGLYYVFFPTVGLKATERVAHAEVRYHKLGTDPKNDRVERGGTGAAQKFPSAWASRDGHWLFYSVDRDSHEDDVWFRDLRQPGSAFKPLMVGLPAFSGVESFGDRFIVHTDYQAPRGRVLMMDPAHPSIDAARVLVAEDPSALLEEAAVVGGKLVLRWLRDATSQLEIRDLDGKSLRQVPLPELGTVGGISGEPDKDELYFGFASFTTPDRIFRTSVNGGVPELWSQVKVPIDTSPYMSEQVWFPSKDGTRIPMFIVRRKDLRMDGSTPVILDGYGGFAINITPYFAIGTWMESGGAWALPNLRGGGELGESWHKAGIRERKQNVFDDFIAAAEFLVAKGYTSRPKLAIEGGSNGGLLMGAALTQRPDLFRAVVCQVPLLDMLRYQKFGIAAIWATEYGSPDVEADFGVLAAYSPYHHVRATRYPAVLLMSSDSDDRVDPLHARKMAAALQAANTATTPILLRVEAHAGHGGSDARAAEVEESADRSLFLFRELGFAARPGAPWLEKSAKPQ